MSLRTSERDRTRRGTVSSLPVPFAVGLGLSAAAAFVSAIVGLIRGDGHTELELGLLLVAAVAAAATGLLARVRPAAHVTASMAMSMLVAAWLGVTVGGAAAFLISGEFETAGDAVFEAVSATTTTGFTTIDAPETLPMAVRLLRVSLQWAAGLGVLVGGMGVLPVAIAGVELAPARPLDKRRQIATSIRAAFRNIVGLYVLLTVSLAVGFIVAGMGPFDGVSYALSTASTGGMANHADSIGHFDSDLIEWIATAGMVAAGGSLMVVWWAIRGALEPIWRSTELRLYISLLFLGFLAVWLIGGGTSATDAAFAISSMLSTTGLRASNWAAGTSFVHAVLMIAAGVGAMSGSVGSGFRLARVARVALEVRRGLRRLLYPHQVEIIRMDGIAVNEESLERTYGYLWMHLLTLASVAAIMNAGALDFVGKLTFSVSLMSNVGVVITDGTITSAVPLNGWSQLVAGVGMVLGRLSIYPVLVTAAGVSRWLSRRIPHRAIGAEA